MDVPHSGKQLSVMERTAKFIIEEGIQMEIVMKAKQAQNPLFGFLNFDDILNPFYQHLRSLIKDGKHVPQPPATSALTAVVPAVPTVANASGYVFIRTCVSFLSVHV